MVTTSSLANNQVILTHEDGTKEFQSYGTRVAEIDPQGNVHVTPAWDYSPTTTKYLAQFLGLPGTGAKALIRKNIQIGNYRYND